MGALRRGMGTYRLSEEKQLDLLSHNDDPSTSFRAAARAQPKANSHAGRIYATLRRFLPGGLTASELCAVLVDDADFRSEDHARLYQIRRRLSDLKRMGWVSRGERGDDDEVTWFAKLDLGPKNKGAV